MERSLAAAPGRSGILAAANRIAGVYESLDGGKTWKDAGVGLPVVTSGGLSTLAYSPDGTLWSGIHGEGLWSRNAEGKWLRRTSISDEYRNCTGLAIHPNGWILAVFSSSWITASEAGVFLSRDRGKTWKNLMDETLTHRIIVAAAFHLEDPSLIYAGTAGNGVFVRRVK